MRNLSIMFVLVLVSLPVISFEEYNCTLHSNQNGITQYHYSPHFPIIITDDSDFALLGFTGTGNSSDPYLIQGLNITQSYSCISISSTSVYFIIRNCLLKSSLGDAAISLSDVNHGLIENCLIEGGTYGIHMTRCSFSRISGNVVVGADDSGIQLNQGDFVEIVGNRVLGNDIGIFLNGAENITTYQNRVYQNYQRGIEIAYGSKYNEIYFNWIGWNKDRFGLFDERNALDDGENNTWQWNHWSDYLGSPPYRIPGETDSVDGTASTLQDDVKPVFIANVSDQILQGNTTEFLNWTIIEEFPFTYELYHDGVLVHDGYLLSKNIEIPLGLYQVGEHNFTIWVRDGYGNFNITQQIVHIISSTDTTPVLLAGIGIGMILLVLIIWEKKIRSH